MPQGLSQVTSDKSITSEKTLENIPQSVSLGWPQIALIKNDIEEMMPVWIVSPA